MNTKNRTAVIVLTLTLLTAGCFHGGPAYINVLTLGDENAIGYTNALQADDVWCANAPMRGNLTNTWQALDELNDWLDAYGGRHEIIVFGFGLGDIVRLDDRRSPSDAADPVTSVDDYVLNLTILVERARAVGATVLFTTLPDVPESLEGFYSADVAAYNAAAVDAMNALDVPVIDLNAAMKPYAHLQQQEGTSWELAGYEIMANSIKPALSGLGACDRK